jgi:hypothetical protein
LQSIPQQFSDDEDGVDVASPGDLKSKHESFSFAQNGTGFFTNGRKLLEFEPALIQSEVFAEHKMWITRRR